MANPLPVVWLARHGETEWSAAGRHTGRTDIPLTERGERDAARLGARLTPLGVSRVFASPLLRARRTAELAGFAPAIDPELAEWHYGELEGITTVAFRESRPGWLLFRDGPPGGETLAEVSDRADRVVERLRGLGADALVFSHGHFLRFLAARWLGLDGNRATNFFLSTAAVCALGYEHALDRPAIRLWNDTGHLEPAG